MTATQHTISVGLLLLLSMIPRWSLCQTRIQGQVSNRQGEPLMGANLYVEGSYDGATADSTGAFDFITYTEDTSWLKVSFIGYNTHRHPVVSGNDLVDLQIILKSTERTIDGIVITAGAFEASDEKKGVLLRPLDIVTTAGATADIASALNTLPGTQTVGEEGQLFVRGGAAYETQTFIDGLRVQSPYSSSVPNVAARGRFSPFLFKGTLFSTGAYSAEYGQALSSALILNTEDLAAESITGISLMSVGGELSHTKKWDNQSLAISGNYSHLGPYFSLIPQNMNWNKAPSSIGSMAIFRRKTSDTGILKAMTSFSKADLDIRFPSLDEPGRMDTYFNRNTNLFFNTSCKELIANKWLLRVGFAYTRNLEDIQPGEIHLRQIQHSGQGKIALSRPVGDRINLRMGTTGILSRYEESFSNSPDGDFPFVLNLTERFLAGYAEADISLTSKWAVRAGGRWEYSALLNHQNLAPRLSMAYQSSDYSQFSLAYGQFFQTPPFELMRYTQELDFEKAEHLILNYQFIKNKRIFRVEAYHKLYDALVKFNPLLETDPQFYQNSGSGYANGLDIFWRDQQSFKNTDYWVSYSFLDTERDYRHFPYSSTPYYASRHNFSLVTKHFIPKIETQIGFTYSYASPRPYNNPNETLFNNGRTPHYHNLSFNASHLLSLKGHFTVLYISATNLLGSDQIFGYRFGSIADGNGTFRSSAIRPPAKRFLFVGLFISLNYRDGRR